jgi:thiol:disulfide interchange protein DsbC
MSILSRFLRSLILCTAATLSVAAHADEDQIRKNLLARLTDIKEIDEIRKTPVPGIYEVRFGYEIYYTDEKGEYLIRGPLVEVRTGKSLTDEYLNKLVAFDFEKLPFKDALVWKKGKGTRRMVVFADPFCSYCRHLEAELQKLDDVTVYTFMIPIISAESPAMSRDIWCSKDRGQAWRAWMLDGKKPQRAMGKCDTPMDRNLALATKHNVRSTPDIVYADNSRNAGAAPAAQIEKKLAAATAGKP